MSAVVIRGDARQLPLPDGSADLIVTSPPYRSRQLRQSSRSRRCAQIGDEWPAGTRAGMCRRVGKRTAGRELDGRTWDEYPPAVTP